MNKQQSLEKRIVELERIIDKNQEMLELITKYIVIFTSYLNNIQTTVIYSEIGKKQTLEIKNIGVV